MSFVTPVFFLFLPVTLLLCRLLPGRWRQCWLLAASLFFYGWGGPVFVLIMFFSAVLDYCCGLVITAHRGRLPAKLALAASVLVNLGLLSTFKYTDFLIGTANSLFGTALPLMHLPLPIGISFYTFQTMSYTIDVYRGKLDAERDFISYALYVSFFPQLVAGPIERPQDLLPQLKTERRPDRRMLSRGGWLLLLGYFKKIVVADTLAPLADRVFAAPGQAAGPQVILAAVFFGLQIYCDFSGYTDIARGCGALLGVELSENFRRPYSASSVRDFWRRWHMTLTGWFRDYVYYPLGGSRKGKARQIRNIFIVFLLSGLWHGAGWTFVLWGAFHGLCQALEVLCQGKLREPEPLARARTLVLVFFGWLIFRAQSLSDLALLLSRLPVGWTSLPFEGRELLTGAFLALAVGLADRLEPERPGRKPERLALAVFSLVTVTVICRLAFLAGGGENAFIYFQF